MCNNLICRVDQTAEVRAKVRTRVQKEDLRVGTKDKEDLRVETKDKEDLRVGTKDKVVKHQQDEVIS